MKNESTDFNPSDQLITTLNESRQLDLLIFKKKYLETRLKEVDRVLNTYAAENDKISHEFQILNSKYSEIEKENLGLSGITGSIQHYDKIHQNCEFFQQIRILETEIEYLVAQISKNKEIIKKFQPMVSSFNAKQRRLIKQIETLKTSLCDIERVNKEKKSIMNNNKSIILSKQQELDQEAKLCEDLKLEILDVSSDLQFLSRETLSRLHTEKKEVLVSIKQKKEYISKKKIKMTEHKSHNRIAETKSNHEISALSSPMKWMSERNYLLARIKKANDELSSLESRLKNGNKNLNAIHNKMQTISDDDIKRAIILEIQDISNQNTGYYAQSIEIETQYHQKLFEERQKIQQSTQQINEFRDRVNTQIEKQQNALLGSDRITLLKEELRQLKLKL